MSDRVNLHGADPEWQADIVRRIRCGDITALAELYDRAAARVFGYALAIAHNRSEARLVTRQVFLDVWESPSLLSDPRVPPTVALARLTTRVVEEGTAIRRAVKPATGRRRGWSPTTRTQ